MVATPSSPALAEAFAHLQATSSYVIADIGLADFGRKELNIAETEMPFTDNAGLVTGLAKHGRKSKPARFNAERCVTIEDRVLLGGLTPGVFAG